VPAAVPRSDAAAQAGSMARAPVAAVPDAGALEPLS
jgi:hypothetical protein